MKQLIKKYPKVVGLLEDLLRKKMISLNDVMSTCGVDKETAKAKVIPELIEQGALERYNTVYRRGPLSVIAKLLASLGKKVDVGISVTSIDDLVKLPRMKHLTKTMLVAKIIPKAAIAEALSLTNKDDLNTVVNFMLEHGILTLYYNNSYKPADLSGLCAHFEVNQQQENTKAHNDTLVPWSWFTEDINRLRVVIKATTMDSQGRNVESVKASLIAGELGVQKREFINSYAPTLIKREVIAQLGKGYMRGARFKEYVRIITAEADAETPYIGGKHEPRKLTAEQKRKAAQTTKTSIKQLERRRAKAIEIADEWHEGGLLTKKEHQMRVDDINAEYDALIQNLSQKEKKA